MKFKSNQKIANKHKTLKNENVKQSTKMEKRKKKRNGKKKKKNVSPLTNVVVRETKVPQVMLWIDLQCTGPHSAIGSDL